MSTWTQCWVCQNWGGRPTSGDVNGKYWMRKDWKVIVSKLKCFASLSSKSSYYRVKFRVEEFHKCVIQRRSPFPSLWNKSYKHCVQPCRSKDQLIYSWQSFYSFIAVSLGKQHAFCKTFTACSLNNNCVFFWFKVLYDACLSSIAHEVLQFSCFSVPTR